MTPPDTGLPLDRIAACATAERAIELTISAPHRWAGSCSAGSGAGDAWFVVRAADTMQRSGRIERAWWLVQLESGAGTAVDATVLPIDDVCLAGGEPANCTGGAEISDVEALR